MLQTKFKTRTFLILILTLTLTYAQITENPRYPKDYKIKSLYAFDTSYAFDLSKASKETLKITANKGKIIQQHPLLKKSLPKTEFQASSILRVDTESSNLSIIAFNKKQRYCVLYIKWSNSGENLHTYQISREECNTMRVTRFGRYNAKLVSYINQNGNFNWYVKKNFQDESSEFKIEESVDLYKDGILQKGKQHDVQVFYSKEDESNDSILVYQRHSHQSQKESFPMKISYFSSNSKNGELDSKSVLTFKNYNYPFNEMLGYRLSSSYNYFSVKYFNDYHKNGDSILFLNYRDGNQVNKLFINSFNNNKLAKNERQSLFYEFSSEGSSSTNRAYIGLITHSNTPGVKKSYFLSEKGLKICTPSSDSIENLKQTRDIIKSSCLIKTDQLLEISEDEYLDTVTLTDDNIAVVNIQTIGAIEDNRQVVVNFSNKDFLKKIDVDENVYSSHENALYEVKKTFSTSEDPFYYVMYSESGNELKNYLSVKGVSDLSELTLKASDGVSGDVEHKILFNFVEKFEENKVNEDEVYVHLTKGDIGKVITSPDEVVIRGDEILDLPDFSKTTFFGFTPLRFVTESTLKIKNRNFSKLRKLKIQEEKQEPIEDEIEEEDILCNLDDYYLFSKSGVLHSFSPRFPGSTNKRFLLSDLRQHDIKIGDFTCLSKQDLNLIIIQVKDTESKNVYVAIHFEEKTGEYSIRRFSTDYEDILKVKEAFYSAGGKRYSLLFEDDSRALLKFGAVYPIFRIENESVKTGEAVLMEKKVGFDVTVNQVIGA